MNRTIIGWHSPRYGFLQNSTRFGMPEKKFAAYKPKKVLIRHPTNLTTKLLPHVLNLHANICSFLVAFIAKVYKICTKTINYISDSIGCNYLKNDSCSTICFCYIFITFIHTCFITIWYRGHKILSIHLCYWKLKEIMWNDNGMKNNKSSINSND